MGGGILLALPVALACRLGGALALQVLVRRHGSVHPIPLRAKCMLAAEEVLEEVCALKLVSWFGSVQVPFPELRTGLLVRFNPEPEPDHILRRKEGNGTHIRACPFTGGTYASSSQARSE